MTCLDCTIQMVVLEVVKKIKNKKMEVRCDYCNKRTQGKERLDRNYMNRDRWISTAEINIYTNVVFW